MKIRSINRRNFFKTCLSTATAVAANPNLLAQPGLIKKEYAPALLKDENGEPFTSESFHKNNHFIFNYPFVTTPCFLINLDTPVIRTQQLATADDSFYQWPGGVGPNKSVVAFSAICAHKLSYPTRSISFINYRSENITYVNNSNESINQKQLIYCCSERSVYDPAKGAKVLGGPAPQPLTAIIINHNNDTDNYYATATLGGELFNQFFKIFSYQLALDGDNKNIRQIVEHSTMAYTTESYTSQKVIC
jgi:Rieske Fe-S protein